MATAMQYASIGTALLSAGCWFYGALVRIMREDVVARLKRNALKSGKQPNLSGMSYDGWDVFATLAAQSKWNAWGATFALLAVVLQVLAPAA